MDKECKKCKGTGSYKIAVSSSIMSPSYGKDNTTSVPCSCKISEKKKNPYSLKRKVNKFMNKKEILRLDELHKKSKENPLPKDWGKFNFEVEENLSKDKIKEGVKKALKEYTPEKLRDYNKGEEWVETEEFINKLFSRAEIPEYANDAKRPIVDYIQTKVKKEKEKSKLEVLDIPMGVSAWMNHGKKYGYDKFWKDKIVEETLEIAIGEEKEQSRINVKRVRDDVNSWVGGYNKKRSEIISIKESNN